MSILPKLNILVNSSNQAVITDVSSARIVREAREIRASTATHRVAPAAPVARTANQRSGALPVVQLVPALEPPGDLRMWNPKSRWFESNGLPPLSSNSYWHQEKKFQP